MFQEDFNLTLPEWTNGIYPNRLIPLTVFSFVLNAYNTELQKLKGGKLSPCKHLVNMIKFKIGHHQKSLLDTGNKQLINKLHVKYNSQTTY